MAAGVGDGAAAAAEPAAALAASGGDRCADTIEWRDIPAGSYREGKLGRFTVNGHGAAANAEAAKEIFARLAGGAAGDAREEDAEHVAGVEVGGLAEEDSEARLPLDLASLFVYTSDLQRPLRRTRGAQDDKLHLGFILGVDPEDLEAGEVVVDLVEDVVQGRGHGQEAHRHQQTTHFVNC